MSIDETIRKTHSICPVCHKKIPASLIRTESGKIIMKKTCPAHGAFSAPAWRGFLDYEEWVRSEPPLTEEQAANCSGDCRNCTTHSQASCCVLLEVTKSCDLHCSYCFAKGGDSSETPPFSKLCKDIDIIINKGHSPLIQFSGGEPTLRDDLPELILYAKSKGCSYTQVNTNGIRLSKDPWYVKSLAKAGLDIVFLQFDGTDDDVYRTLRGRDLLSVKKRAIDNCSNCGLGVTLVPTIVRGINDHQVGDIIRFALSCFPTVRSVHFQPVTFLGRTPKDPVNDDRFTLDEMMKAVICQTEIPENALLPSRCDHAACEFHSTFLINDKRQLVPISDRSNDSRTCRTSAEKNRQYVADHWRRTADDPFTADTQLESLSFSDPDLPLVANSREDLDFDTFISYMKTRTFKISSMAFQDAMNIDLERMYRCSLHVFENGKLLPFCGKYLK